MVSRAALNFSMVQRRSERRKLTRVRCVVFLVWQRHRTRPQAGYMWLHAHAECQPQGCGTAAAMLSAFLALRAEQGSLVHENNGAED